MMVDGPDWVRGRYPQVVDWLCRQHDHGALLASACTGVLLLAETGLLKGREATIHWAFAPTFHRNFPDVCLHTEEALIAVGDEDGDEDIVMTGGVMSWHDLALYLIARYVGPVAAQAMARMLMLEWHGAGQAPYIEFTPELGHGDGLVAERQRWLERHYMIANPVEEMTTGSGLSRRTLERRFHKATGRSPISYIQQLRIREARRLLERTTMPIDEIGFVLATRTRRSSGVCFNARPVSIPAPIDENSGWVRYVEARPSWELVLVAWVEDNWSGGFRGIVCEPLIEVALADITRRIWEQQPRQRVRR
jgi:transcriptional regulator GlxA family with amidase domain